LIREQLLQRDQSAVRLLNKMKNQAKQGASRDAKKGQADENKPGWGSIFALSNACHEARDKACEESKEEKIPDENILPEKCEDH